MFDFTCLLGSYRIGKLYWCTCMRSNRLKWIGLLIAGLVCISRAALVAAPTSGPLRVHPDNPRYFTDGDKAQNGSLRAIYLTGAHTWNNLVDMGRSDPPEAFDFERYLEFLERYHHNFIRLWAWDSLVWDTQANGSLGKDFVHHVAPLPWSRTGPGDRSQWGSSQ